MKTKKFAIGAVLLACCLFAFVSLLAVFGQTTGVTRSVMTRANTFAMATNLLALGEPGQAQKLLATITTNNTEYPAAQCYQALCFWRMTNRLEFLKKMESPAAKRAVIGRHVRQDLTYKYIQDLFFYRKFEKIFPQIELFLKSYPRSKQSPMVGDYAMATLFERGMKKAIEAANLHSPAQSNKRWLEARTNLRDCFKIHEC